ncbi:hypothetical protein CR513_29159, partial [Mucuna pruriens]
MIEFFDACHINMWDIMGNDNYIPINKKGAKIPISSWNEEQKTRCLLNSRARNLLMCALTKIEYKKAHSCKSLKEMWDTLTLAYKTKKDLTFKAFKAEESYEDTSDKDCSNEDELSFIFKKIHSMWKQKRGSRWKNNNKKHIKEGKDETLTRKKEEEKKKPFIKRKKILMTNWEDLDLSSPEDEDEEANICFMTNTTSDNEVDEEKANFVINSRFRIATVSIVAFFQFSIRFHDCDLAEFWNIFQVSKGFWLHIPKI